MEFRGRIATAFPMYQRKNKIRGVFPSISRGQSTIDNLFHKKRGDRNNQEIHSATTENADDVHALLAREMHQMTINEREKAYESLHGVDQAVKETPEFVDEKLVALEEAISTISPKDAYDEAEQANADYVHGRKLRLMFLRAEIFDTKKAATRMVKFLEGKLKYFGLQALTRSICLNDLDRDDRESLKTGQLQYLNERDRSGRSVFCRIITSEGGEYKHPRNMIKTFIYLLTSAAEDEENKKSGLVFLLYQIGNMKKQQNHLELISESSKVIHWSPLRMSGVHMCLEDPIMRMLGRIFLGGAGRDFRVRYRLHEGTHTKRRYNLTTFGIPVDAFPITPEGTLKKKEHTRWIAKHKAKEELLKCGKTFKLVDLSSRNDVLLGKGKPSQQHPGNVNLRALVDSSMEEYQSTKRRSKGPIISRVVEGIKTGGGRFLKKDEEGWWSNITDGDARLKVVKLLSPQQLNTAIQQLRCL